MQLQVDAEYDLDDEHEHQKWRKRRVDVMGKLTTTVGVTKEVSDYRENDAKDLKRYVPSGANDLRSDQTGRDLTME